MWTEDFVQIENINYLNLSIEVNSTANEDEEHPFISINLARTNYDETDHNLGVKMMALMGYDQSGERQKNVPFWLKVEVEVVFNFDQNAFDFDRLQDWVEKVAPSIIYPYVSESVYSLTHKAGFDDIRLPLLRY